MCIRDRVAEDKCCGCRVCELVCALYHTGVFEPTCSAVRRHSLTPDLHFRLVVCAQCPNMPCAAACPVDAIHRDAASGGLVVDSVLCVLCGACAEACPFGALRIVGERLVACDLCGGDPLCVQWCPRGALSVVECIGDGASR